MLDATTAGLVAASATPDDAENLGDPGEFIADNVLLSAFVIALGVPAYDFLGFSAGIGVIVGYAMSALLLPVCVSLAVGVMRSRGRLTRAVWRASAHAFAWTLPAVALAVVAIARGMQLAFVGVSVMVFAAVVFVAFVSSRFSRSQNGFRMEGVRTACALLTPLLLAGFGQVLPHGMDVMLGWAVPVPVALSGAIGAGLSLALPRKPAV